MRRLGEVVAIVQARRVEIRIARSHGVAHRDAREWLAEIEGQALILERGLAEHVDRAFAQHRFDEIHGIAVVRIGLIELEHRELGVVARAQPLVAEVAVDFVHALEATDDEALQVQLRRDAQEQVAVERVVMRDEWPRRRAAGDRLQHRRLDLDEALAVEEAADEAHDAGADAEGLAHLGVHDQVDIALAVARLGVGQASPLLGQRAHGLDQQLDARDLDRQLAGLGAEHGAAGADDVADVPGLELGIALGTDGIGLHEQLHAPGHVLDLREARLAHHALGDETAGQHVHLHLAFERGGVERAVARLQVGGQRVAAEAVREGLTERAQLLELLAAIGDDVVVVAARLVLRVLRFVAHSSLTGRTSGWLQCTDRGGRRAPSGCRRFRHRCADP